MNRIILLDWEMYTAKVSITANEVIIVRAITKVVMSGTPLVTRLMVILCLQIGARIGSISIFIKIRCISRVYT